jgi:uncharacterized protein YukE
MTRPQDVPLLVVLERQLTELAYITDRVEAAQRGLIPAPASFWGGTARHAYDAAIDSVASTMQGIAIAVGSARDKTSQAIREVQSRV